MIKKILLCLLPSILFLLESKGNSTETACLKSIDSKFVFYGGDELIIHAVGKISSDQNASELSLVEFFIEISGKKILTEQFAKIIKDIDGVKLETLVVGREANDEAQVKKGGKYLYHLTFDVWGWAYAGGEAGSGESRKRMLITFDLFKIYDAYTYEVPAVK